MPPRVGCGGEAGNQRNAEGAGMKVWKRNLLIAYVACSALAVVFYYILAATSMWPTFAKVLLYLLGLAPIAGGAAGLWLVVRAFFHERATLHVGSGGTINIERSALESTARRALASLDGVTLEKVAAHVVERHGEPVIDVSVTAVPYGAESLMATAGRIQTAVKQSVEAFTDHEVRYVAVNFVEPRRRSEVKAAQHAVDARAEEGYTPKPYEGIDGAAPFVPTCPREESAPRPSLWERLKGRVEELRASRASARDEDVVETPAVVLADGDGADGAEEPSGERPSPVQTEGEAADVALERRVACDGPGDGEDARR